MPENEDAQAPLINSIEGTLFEAFGILSPASLYLSEKVEMDSFDAAENANQAGTEAITAVRELLRSIE